MQATRLVQMYSVYICMYRYRVCIVYSTSVHTIVCTLYSYSTSVVNCRLSESRPIYNQSYEHTLYSNATTS